MTTLRSNSENSAVWKDTYTETNTPTPKPQTSLLGKFPFARLSDKEQPSAALILIIDDEPMIRNVVSEVLSLAGFRVVSAANGAKALSLYEDHRDDIETVLLDYDLPHMDGEQIFLKLRQLNPLLRIIISSSYIPPAVKHRLNQENCVEFLPKPYNLATLFAKVIG